MPDGVATGDDFAGRTAIVTGGSKGIGREIAHRLAAARAHVLITGRSEQALAEACEASPGQIMGVAGDAADKVSVEQAVDKMMEAHGRIDMLVNNAGGALEMGPLLGLGAEHFERTFEFNLKVPFLWAKAVHDAWMGENSGTILNISSVGGINVPAKMGAYATMKAGLNQMTRVLAAELAPTIRVNGLAPGLTRSESTKGFADRPELVASIIPLERAGEPEDIANAALFLLGDQSSWITGETLVVDGGTLVETGRIRRN